ncbi:hypothetical protein D9M72_510790 [compost metagenome]
MMGAMTTARSMSGVIAPEAASPASICISPAGITAVWPPSSTLAASPIRDGFNSSAAPSQASTPEVSVMARASQPKMVRSCLLALAAPAGFSPVRRCWPALEAACRVL